MKSDDRIIAYGRQEFRVLKVFSAICILLGAGAGMYAASMMTGRGGGVSGPSWLYSHY